MNFYRELLDIEAKLVDKGLEVGIPVSAQHMKETQDFDPSKYKNSKTYPERSGIIRRNFDLIKDSDGILVINNEKNGMKGYIGPNVLMEIALAFYFNKKVYILNPIELESPYLEELRCFGVEEINGDLDKIYV